MKVIFRSVLLLCLLQFAYCVEIIAEDEIVKYNVSKDLILQCNVKNGDGTKQQFKWKKDDKEVHTIDSLQNRITLTENENNATLTISKATENDAGNYTCTGTAGQANIIATTPITVNTPENVNVVEGDKLRIVCVVGGRPSPQVFWTVGGVNYTSSAGHIILQEDEKNVSNAVLLIDNVNMTYKGPYKCIGYSSLTNEFVEDEAMVRVKDKYAALWPFLGICLEVFVLCAVILIYEKKRNKSELEESDTDQSPDQKNTPDHGKESNLRHRQ